jgi:ribosome-associated protein
MSKKEDQSLADLAHKVATALDDGKAVDIRVLDVRKLTVITDYMIIASGRSNRQVRALAQRVMDTARELGVKTLGIEGERESEWILIDLGGVVVHVMQPATRDFYQLEKLWEQRAAAQVEA